jgi:hypothetical protein
VPHVHRALNPRGTSGSIRRSAAASQDVIARFSFLAKLNTYKATVVAGDTVAFHGRAEIVWVRERREPPQTRGQVRRVMAGDPHHRFWSALRRCGRQMRQQAGRSLVLRQAESLRDRAREPRSSLFVGLQLDPVVTVPRYRGELDNHRIPGAAGERIGNRLFEQASGAAAAALGASGTPHPELPVEHAALLFAAARRRITRGEALGMDAQ